MPAAKRASKRRKAGRGGVRKTARPARGRKWSRRVTEHSDVLTLKKGVFASRSPSRIAASLKRSAERSQRRKSGPYRSAMSMLTFYLNRGGKGLSAGRRRILERAKEELRHQFGRS